MNETFISYWNSSQNLVKISINAPSTELVHVMWRSDEFEYLRQIA